MCRRLSKWLNLSRKSPVVAVTGADEPAVVRPLTDSGNAERFVAKFGEEIRHCYPWKKWLVWDGKRFRRDDAGRVIGLSKAVARSIREEVDLTDDEKIQERITKWARTSENLGRRNAMVTLTASELGIGIVPDELDGSQWLLNVENGTIDLRTGKTRPHRREDLITKVAPVTFDPEVQCPEWMKFLERVLPDESVRDFVQKAVGYSLTGDVSAQILILLYGTGANGKSTFLCILLDLLGSDYAIQAAPEILLTKSRSEHPTELADLFGVRAAVCTEIGVGRRFNEVLVKQLTGGDKIRARRLYEDFWEFRPTHKLWIAANHKPIVQGTDHAIWRRIRLVPFTVRIPEDEQDPQLLEKLRRELSGILNWAMEGRLRWQKEGLEPPEAVQAATSAYREEMDALADFLETWCVAYPKARVGASELYHRYTAWCEDNAEDPLDQRAFGMRMTERGFDRGKVRGKKVYKGIGLLSEGHGGDHGDDGGPNSDLVGIRRSSGRGGDLGGFEGSAHDAHNRRANRRESGDGPPWSPSSPPSGGVGVEERGGGQDLADGEEEAEWRG